MMKKILAAVLSAAMCMSLAACGGSSSGGSTALNSSGGNSNSNTNSSTSSEGTEDVSGSGRMFTFKDQELETFFDFDSVNEITDPQAIYDSLEYNEKMLYGRYTISDKCESYILSDMEKTLFSGDMDFEMRVVGEDGEKEVSTLPYTIHVGAPNVLGLIGNVEEHEWMELYYLDKDGYWTSEFAAYTVSGNTLSVYSLLEEDYDDVTNHISYRLSETPIEYTFAFQGLSLTLTRDGKSVTMHPDVIGADEYNLYLNSVLSEDSPALGDVKMLYMEDGPGSGSGDHYAVVETTDGVWHTEAAAQMREDGLFTFMWEDEESSGAYQFVCFYTGSGNIILTDGEQTYYFGDEYDFYKDTLSSSLMVDDADSLEAVGEEKLNEIVEKRASLFEELSAGFTDAGLDVTVDPESGEIAMDAAVLFGVDEYAVTEEGKSFLNRFLEVYTSVVFSAEYDGFVSKILVEGHTDSTGTYEHNQELSQNRAESVMNYCLSPDTGLDSASTANLESLLHAVGYSCDKLIYDAEGNEDMDASRRVSFRFLISLE